MTLVDWSVGHSTFLKNGIGFRPLQTAKVGFNYITDVLVAWLRGIQIHSLPLKVTYST